MGRWVGKGSAVQQHHPFSFIHSFPHPVLQFGVGRDPSASCGSVCGHLSLGQYSLLSPPASTLLSGGGEEEGRRGRREEAQPVPLGLLNHGSNMACNKRHLRHVS